MAGFGAKVKLTVDRSSRAEFNKQINDMVGQIKISNKFTVLQKDMDRVRKEAQAMLNSNPMTLKVNKIDCSAAVTDVKNQLQNMLSSLSVSNGVNITGLKDFIGTGIQQTADADKIEQVGDAVSDAAKKAAELADAADSASSKLSDAGQQASKSREEIVAYTTQLNVLKTVLRSVESVYKSASFGNSMLMDPSNIEKVTDAVNRLKLHIEDAGEIDIGNIDSLEHENRLIKQEAQELIELVSALQQVEAAEKAFNSNAGMSSERIAQLSSLKSVIDSLSTTFKSAIFGKDMLSEAASIQEITDKFVECTTKAKEALSTPAGDDAILKERVVLIEKSAKELTELIALKRQLETPSTEFDTQIQNSSHPIDQERWFSFICETVDDGRICDTDTLVEFLQDETYLGESGVWDEERAWKLASEYESACKILQYYKWTQEC